MKKSGFLLFVVIASLIMPFSALAQDDDDADGYCTTLGNGACPDHPDELDCNDNNPMINPGASEGATADGLDNDCNGLIDDMHILCADSDFDMYNKTLAGGTTEICGRDDCDDTSAFINPGVQEICGDGADNDCDGRTDADDPDCQEAGGEEEEDTECRILAESGWYNCDTPAQMLSTANDTDTVFLIIFTENCDAESEVEFNISEYNAGQQPLSVGAFNAQSKIINMLDEEGNPTGMSVWFGAWVASYMADADGSDPEYYFEAQLTAPGNNVYKFNGQQAGRMLSVKECPAGNPNCGVACAFASPGGAANYTGGGGGNITCATNIDCTNAVWSECNPETNVRTRDVTKCKVPSSDPACIAKRRSEVVAEQSCLSATRPDTPSLQHVTGGVQQECGDGNCDEGEDADNCPDDCEAPKGTNWALIIFIVVAVLLAAGAIAGYFIVKKKKGAAGTKAAAKPAEAMPFASQKDLDSVVNYITLARQKGLPSEQIAKLLAQGGWKDGQIKYAFAKLSPAAQQQKMPFANKQEMDAIVNYINSAKQRGMSEQQIRVSLLTSGRSEEQVKFASDEAAKRKAEPAKQPAGVQQKKPAQQPKRKQ